MWTLFFVQVINRLGDFVAPFLTLFLTVRLGMPKAAAGLYVSLTIGAGLAGILVAGKLSDALGRKPVLEGGMLLSAITLGLAGFFVSEPWVVWLLVAMSFFQGMVRPAIAALIADLVPPEGRKDAYSLNYLGINVGVAIGPTLAGFLFSHAINWLFWGDALSSLAAVALTLRFIPSVRKGSSSAVEDRPVDERQESKNPLASFFSRPLLVGFCALCLANSFMYEQIHFALPLATGALTFGWLISFNAVVVLAGTPPIAVATRRQHPLVSMGLGSLFFAAGFSMLALPLSAPLLFASTFVWTIGEIFFSINSGVYLAAKTPCNLRGQFQSYRECIASVGRMIGPIFGGIASARLGLPALWLIVGGVGLFTAIGFAALKKADR